MRIRVEIDNIVVAEAVTQTKRYDVPPSMMSDFEKIIQDWLDEVGTIIDRTEFPPELQARFA